MLPRGWAALVVVAMFATRAGAQVSDKLGIERFRAAIDRRGLASVEWADVPAHLHWDAGLLVGFEHAPLVIYDRDMGAIDALVDRRLGTTLVGSLGLFGRVQLGAAVDVVGYQAGLDGSASPTMKSLPAGGLGDVRLIGKAKLAGADRYQIAVMASLTVPAGASHGFLREAGVTFAPALALSSTLGRLRGALNVGYLMRPSTDTAGVVSDDEGFIRAGLAVAATERAEAFVAYAGSAPLTDADRNQVASELLAGGNVELSPSLGVFVAGGVGLDNGFGTPDWRVLAGVRFGSAAPTRAAVVIQPPPVVEPPPPPSMPPVVEAPKPPAIVEGRILDPSGRPIPGASLVGQVDSDNEPLAIDVDEDGRFKRSIVVGRAGTATLTAFAPEYEQTAVQVELAPGASASTTITLVRKVRQGQLRGQVLSFDGKPLSATIKITGPTTTEVTADADGNFTVELPAGTFRVEISATGHRPQKRSVTVKLDGVTVLNVDLRGAK